MEKQKKKKIKKTVEARRYFLTIPKCEIEKEKIENLLKEKEDLLSQYMIGEEKHIDGTKHYHIYLKYSKKRNFSFSHFDYLGKHGKLEVCRNPRGSFMYISKEDKKPLANFDYEGGILSGKPEEIAKYLAQTGRNYSDLFKQEKQSIHELATKWRSIKAWEQEYIEEKRLVYMQENKKGIREINDGLMKEKLTEEECSLIKQDEGLQKIIKHINQMLCHKWQRPFKMKNILIWSTKPGIGKTSLIRKLMEYCPMYGFPMDQWFEGYKSEIFWGILWNEMSLIGMDLEMLKNFLEGTAVKLNIKGSKVEKRDNPQVFMTANFGLKSMIEDKYKNMNKREVNLAALKERIEEVNVDNYDNIFFLSKLLVKKD